MKGYLVFPKCGVIKHVEGSCAGQSSLRSTGMANTKQYGSWLRASSFGPNSEFAHNLSNQIIKMIQPWTGK